MWVFAENGFISIVRHRHKPEFVLVRARVEVDLGNFVAGCGEMASHYAIEHTPEADYPWRVMLPKGVAANGLVRQLLDIDYPNFKAAIEERVEWDRDDAYGKVWGAMRELGDVLAGGEQLAAHWANRLDEAQNKPGPGPK
tara:strand:+ start:2683 stop:3102 length:420 start_codon:yes stop_codon:yes gene_type:complete